MSTDDPYKRLAIYWEQEVAKGDSGAYCATPVRFYPQLALSRRGNFLCTVLTLPPAPDVLPVFRDTATIRMLDDRPEWFQLGLPNGQTYRISDGRIYSDDDLEAIDDFLADRGL
ncbi:MAG TPA: hypothetical protein VM581_00250 [Magnetospirillaceae bacterium]|nr:hypothetical protein [Magnetospirillaceae bacterium]